MVKHSSPYHPTFRRLAAAWLALFAIAQLAAPVHGWLEASPAALHHDGFTWSTLPELPHRCEESAAAVACHDNPAGSTACHQDASCHQDAAPGGDSACHDEASCCDDGCGDQGACHDDDCGSCCHHQTIQSALPDQDTIGAVLVLRTAAPAILDILPGIHPNPFLPPRFLS